MELLITFALAMAGAAVHAEDLSQNYNCKCTYYGYPFADVQVFTNPDGTPGKRLHGWISKENPQNAIEFISYTENKGLGDSVLINHNMPVGQEVWGHCTSTVP